MNILFLIILILLTCYAYKISGKDILSPWFILCAMFLSVLIVVLLNTSKWEVTFYGYPVFLIICSLVMWGIGGGIGDLGKKRVKQNKSIKFYHRLQGYYPSFLFCIISFVSAVLYSLMQLQGINFNSGITVGIRQIYENAINNQGGRFIQNQLFEIVAALGYLSIYRLLVKAFILKKEDHLSYFVLAVPVFIFIYVTAIRTDRNIFIRACIYTAVLWIFFLRQRHMKNLNLKIIKRLALMLVVALVIFYGLGKVKQYKSSFFDSMSIYGGSGLYNLNLYINKYPSGIQNSGDSATFYTIKNVFARLGFIEKSSFERIDEFISFETNNGFFYSSNVYTALKTYYYDYGILGMLIFPFISGMLFEWFYRQINQKKIGFSCVLYAALVYPIIYYPILEQMFNRVHFGLVYEIFWLTSMFYMVYGKYGLWRIRTVRYQVKDSVKESNHVLKPFLEYEQGALIHE